jgi:hypothetical protein
MYWHHHWAHCCHSSESITGFATIFATIVIGGIAAYIAWRQYEVAQAKLKLDLFDKRYAIFQQTWEILSETAKHGTREKNYGLGTPFNNFLPAAEFLFWNPIKQYLDEVSTKWTKLYGLEGEGDGAGIDTPAKIAELKTWFFEQASTGAKAQFGRYLDFENWT